MTCTVGPGSVRQPGMALNNRVLIRAIWAPLPVSSRCSSVLPGVSSFIAVAWARGALQRPVVEIESINAGVKFHWPDKNKGPPSRPGGPWVLQTKQQARLDNNGRDATGKSQNRSGILAYLPMLLAPLPRHQELRGRDSRRYCGRRVSYPCANSLGSYSKGSTREMDIRLASW